MNVASWTAIIMAGVAVVTGIGNYVDSHRTKKRAQSSNDVASWEGLNDRLWRENETLRNVVADYERKLRELQDRFDHQEDEFATYRRETELRIARLEARLSA